MSLDLVHGSNTWADDNLTGMLREVQCCAATAPRKVSLIKVCTVEID